MVTRDQAYRACASARFADALSESGPFETIETLLDATRDLWFNQVRGAVGDSLGNSLGYSLGDSLGYSLGDSLTHSPTHSLAHLTHPALRHGLAGGL